MEYYKHYTNQLNDPMVRAQYYYCTQYAVTDIKYSTDFNDTSFSSLSNIGCQCTSYGTMHIQPLQEYETQY